MCREDGFIVLALDFWGHSASPLPLASLLVSLLCCLVIDALLCAWSSCPLQLEC